MHAPSFDEHLLTHSMLYETKLNVMPLEKITSRWLCDVGDYLEANRFVDHVNGEKTRARVSAAKT